MHTTLSQLAMAYGKVSLKLDKSRNSRTFILSAKQLGLSGKSLAQSSPQKFMLQVEHLTSQSETSVFKLMLTSHFPLEQ